MEEVYARLLAIKEFTNVLWEQIFDKLQLLVHHKLLLRRDKLVSLTCWWTDIVN